MFFIESAPIGVAEVVWNVQMSLSLNHSLSLSLCLRPSISFLLFSHCPPLSLSLSLTVSFSLSLSLSLSHCLFSPIIVYSDGHLSSYCSTDRMWCSAIAVQDRYLTIISKNHEKFWRRKAFDWNRWYGAPLIFILFHCYI